MQPEQPPPRHHWSEQHQAEPHAAPATGPSRSSGPPPVRPQRDVTASTGPFMSVEQLAVSAVLDDAKAIPVVARTLKVPTSLISYWVAKADGGSR